MRIKTKFKSFNGLIFQKINDFFSIRFFSFYSTLSSIIYFVSIHCLYLFNNFFFSSFFIFIFYFFLISFPLYLYFKILLCFYHHYYFILFVIMKFFWKKKTMSELSQPVFHFYILNNSYKFYGSISKSSLIFHLLV